MKKKILIIGKKGFIGSNLYKFFKENNLKVNSLNYENFLNSNQKNVDKFDIIINCSSNKKFINNKYHVRNDHDLIIAKKIINSNAMLIMLSTRKVYKPKFDIKESDLKNPNCNYSKNKLLSEFCVKKILMNRILILRISNIIGIPNDNVRKLHKTFLDIFFKAAKRGYIYNNKRIYKDFISIKKFNEIVFELIKKNCFGTYNVSIGKKIYINQIIGWLNFYNSNKVKFIRVNNSFNNDNFTLNNRKLMNKIKIKNSLNDLKNECLKISRNVFTQK